MTWRIRSCPKCNGDLKITQDSLAIYTSCLQCGYYKEEYIEVPLNTDPTFCEMRWNTIQHLYFTLGMVVDTIKFLVGASERTVYRGVSEKRREIGVGYRPRGLSKRAVY